MALQQPLNTSVLPSMDALEASLAAQSALLHSGECATLDGDVSVGCAWCARRRSIVARLRALCDDFDREEYGSLMNQEEYGSQQEEEEYGSHEEEQQAEEPSFLVSTLAKIYGAFNVRFFSSS